MTKHNQNQRIGICGFTYKNYTNIIKDSQGYDLLKQINKSNLKYNKINIYDTFIQAKQIKKNKKKIELILNKTEFIKKSDIIFIMYHFNKYNLPNVKTNKKKYIIDCWRCIKKVPKNYIKIDLGTYSNYLF